MLDVDRTRAIAFRDDANQRLAVGGIARQFVPDENDQSVVRPLMAVTLSAEYRVIDEASGARFITTLRDALEDLAPIIPPP